MASKEKQGFVENTLIFMLVVLVVWMTYILVMPQLWPTGPAQVINPGYWLTFGVLFLLRIARNAIVITVRACQK